DCPSGPCTMADKDVSRLPAPSDEDQRVAARHFEYANRAAVGGNLDIAIGMLRSSCRLVPRHLSYRPALRQIAKKKHKATLRGSLSAPLTTWTSTLRLRRAAARGDHRAVLDHGEAVLARNPWHKGAHLLMAEAAVALKLPVLAIWLLQDYREKKGKDVQVNRALARLLEQEGHFQQAMHLWELVRRAVPTDREAMDKAKQMAVSDTLARGNYEGVMAGEVAIQAPAARPAKPGTSAEMAKLTPMQERAAQEVASLRARLEEVPTDVDSYLRLASINRREGKIHQPRPPPHPRLQPP